MSENQEMMTEKHQIRSYMVDVKAEATIPALGEFVQEIAGNDAQNRGFGYHDLINFDVVWVLSRVTIHVEAYPKWKDFVTFRTWVREIDKLFSIRDFLVFDHHDNILASVSTSWCLIDLKTRRPRKIEDFVTLRTMYPDIKAIEGSPAKIPQTINPEKYPSFIVRYSDLDLYSHVNNVKYMEWMLDVYDLQFREKHVLKTFEINFLYETHFGDQVYIQMEKQPGDRQIFISEVMRLTDNKIVCRSRIEWK